MKMLISRVTMRSFLAILLAWHCATLSDIITGTTIITDQGPILIDKINNGDYVIGYASHGSLTRSRITNISTATTDTIIVIETNQNIIQATPDQLFYDPLIKQWVKSKNLTTKNILLNSTLQHCTCQRITSLSRTVATYRIATEPPHTFFISDAAILTHNFPPL